MVLKRKESRSQAAKQMVGAERRAPARTATAEAMGSGTTMLQQAHPLRPAVRSHTAHSSRRPRKRQRRAKASNPTTPTRRELNPGREQDLEQQSPRCLPGTTAASNVGMAHQRLSRPPRHRHQLGLRTVRVPNRKPLRLKRASPRGKSGTNSLMTTTGHTTTTFRRKSIFTKERRASSAGRSTTTTAVTGGATKAAGSSSSPMEIERHLSAPIGPYCT
mmetsp:Transcript_11798/g.28167  ORF Transcript_11798/g.28167 Transcript_11798/m.28167 type:complete len:218 (-) Transcript_11798:25-678(-)